MNITLKTKIKKLVLGLTVMFIALFAYRLSTATEETFEPAPLFDLTEISETITDIRKNYATQKHKGISGQSPIRMDQKYEKIADIKSVTTQFDREENLIRNKIKDFNGLIQFENKNGNTGYRNLSLIIGVPPANFDSIYSQLITIGTIQAKQITKKDKTNEYKELNAKKLSLEKIRASLIALKSEGGRIEEYMQLENRILEIEQQFQELGVSLGNFDVENEFCTVKFALSEIKEKNTSLLERIESAFLWTLTTYLKLILILTLMSGFSFLTASTIEKLTHKKQK
ncbi:MAG: DUF4349 domain-containing protein [Maribacter sp.]|uniref:DUF4349 domain-containing protein n=1 Tax=Maribacter sp. TaxID=1897614 RepID=UPI003C76BF8C